MFEQLVMQLLSAALVAGIGLVAGWQTFSGARRSSGSLQADSGKVSSDPTVLATKVRDLLLVLSLALVFSVLISPGLLLTSIFELSFPWDTASQFLGMALIAAGSILGAWAFKTLGEFASERIRVAQNHRLVETGPYRLVRHPMYGSTLLIGLGLFLLYLNSVFLILAIPIFGINIYRARVEEKLLSSPEVFGTRYDDYRRRTRGFIPYLL
jgi:protein-S-isoprenylcysteine O-methyltransferase